MAVFEDSQPLWEDKLLLYRHTIDTSGPLPRPSKSDAERVAVPKAEPLKNGCRHFAACIENGSQARTVGHEGLAVLRVLTAVEQALTENLTRKGV